MTKISLDQQILVGAWVFDGQTMQADAIAKMIEQLVSAHLKWLADDLSGWERLYVDPDDQRLWELTYPRGHMHGGGPPTLRCISAVEAQSKYKITI